MDWAPVGHSSMTSSRLSASLRRSLRIWFAPETFCCFCVSREGRAFFRGLLISAVCAAHAKYQSEMSPEIEGADEDTLDKRIVQLNEEISNLQNQLVHKNEEKVICNELHNRTVESINLEKIQFVKEKACTPQEMLIQTLSIQRDQKLSDLFALTEIEKRLTEQNKELFVTMKDTKSQIRKEWGVTQKKKMKTNCRRVMRHQK